MAVRGELKELRCRLDDGERGGFVSGFCVHIFYCPKNCGTPRERKLKQARCSSCGEFLGHIAEACTHALYCSVSCTRQPRLRKDEALCSLVCEQLASGMRLAEVAEYHHMSAQRVHTIKKAF